ncbi:hypothetical protein LENED_008253 [Lentinula edodes]|uniref:Uncharacterized protein n=1 Tax=Lentinula edodes TaxID=5353 RepID=A0A1Q3EGQ4_LENED|nr:hypothetical protein LENED_008253 [Lentinula edodes]
MSAFRSSISPKTPTIFVPLSPDPSSPSLPLSTFSTLSTAASNYLFPHSPEAISSYCQYTVSSKLEITAEIDVFSNEINLDWRRAYRDGFTTSDDLFSIIVPAKGKGWREPMVESFCAS